jgi:hypothetical protein
MSRAQLSYGVDEYGRYVNGDGVGNMLIEPWPHFPDYGWFTWNVRLIPCRAVARIWVLRWFWGTRHQRELWKL